MKSLLTVLSVLAVGCTDDPEPTFGRAESEVATTQGEDWNGEDWNGEDWNGEDWNGEDWNGTAYEGSSWTGTSLSNVTRPGTLEAMTATVTETVLHVWRYRMATKVSPASWEERTPTQICIWNEFRTVKTSCTTYDLDMSPSPLAGIEFRATFRRPDNTTFQAALRIGSSTSDKTAVRREPDDSMAMFGLVGHTSTNSCELVQCDNPDRCRKNCDLWNYSVRVVDVPTSSGQPREICGAGKFAVALAGTWTNGTWAGGTSQFTFACPTGVVAKCLRWGYRPYGSATRKQETHLTALAPYHQACTRAAAADYCGKGTSFTKNGTLVDIFDSGGEDGQEGAYFVPRTRRLFPDTTAYVWESSFTPGGAFKIDHFRYAELSGIEDPERGCPDEFYNSSPTGDDVMSCDSNYASDCMYRFEDYDDRAIISIDSSTGCAHSEFTRGKSLYGGCSGCTSRVAGLLPRCTDSTSSAGWDAECIQKAEEYCTTGYTPMALHSECTIGSKLTVRDTGCSASVCMDPDTASCCSVSGAWDAACVSKANAKCRGGREGLYFVWNNGQFEWRERGFCGTTL